MLQPVQHKISATFLDILKVAQKYGPKWLEHVAIYKHINVFVSCVILLRGESWSLWILFAKSPQMDGANTQV